MKNEILLTGNISESEVALFNKELAEVEIIKAQTKGLTEYEFIQLVFHHFDILTFTRDFILSVAISSSISQIKKLIQLVKKRSKKIESINIEIQIKTKDKEFQLDIISKNADDIDFVVELTSCRMASIVEEADNNCRMEIIIGSDKSDIKIYKMPINHNINGNDN